MRMMATMMRMRTMMMMKTTTMMALKTTSRMGPAQATRARRARMHQQASRLLQWAPASFLRLPYRSLFSSICILRQDPSLTLGNPAQTKVQIPQNLCCPGIETDIWDVMRGAS